MGQAIGVLHLISGGDVGGARTHVLSLLRGLMPRIPVLLAVFRDGPFADEARALGIPLRVLPGGFRDGRRELAEIIRRGEFSILHSHGARANLVSGILADKLGIPSVTTLHSDYRLDYLGRPLARMTFGNLNKWALRRIGYYIGVSRVMADLLRDRGFPPDRVFELYNGLDFSVSSPAVDKAGFWMSLGLGLPPGGVVCGIAARLTPVKDIDTLLRAFAAAAPSCPGLVLVIAGDGPLRTRLQARAEALSVGDRVFFAGWVSDMDSFYRAIDINLLTSLTETFPYALTEGARASLPTVATNVGGVPDLIDHMVSGFLVEPGDDKALASYLIELHNDKAQRVEMGKRLHDKAAALFSLEATLDTQIDIYDAIRRRSLRPVMRRDGVLVCGAYGRGNAGDDAILEGILRELRAASPDTPITVMSRNPKQTKRFHGVDAIHTFSFFRLLRKLRRVKLFISGGGNLIQNVTSQRSLWYYLGSITLARRMGARVLMYACGVGPLKGRFSRRLTSSVLNRSVEAITLREDSSEGDIQKLGISKPRIVLTADPALILNPSPKDRVDSLLKTQGVPVDGGFVAFVLRGWPGFRDRMEAFAGAADYTRETYGLLPLFLPIEKQGDVEVARRTAALVAGRRQVLDYPCRPEDAIGLLQRCRLVVAMRLHALIFASGQGLPMVGVAYDEKVSSFLRYMGQETFIPLSEVTAASLCKLIDEAMSHADTKGDRILAVERLRGIESRNMEILKEMLR